MPMLVIGIKIIIVSLILIAAAACSNAQYKGDALKKDGILKQLQQKGKNAIKPAEMVKNIREYGVNFPITPDVETELARAGAKKEIIDAARDNYRLSDGRRASYLTIKATPSDAQFDIGERASVSGNVAEYALPPETYKVTARKAGYSPQSQIVDLRGPAARKIIDFELKEMTVTELIAEAKSARQRGDDGAVRLHSQTVLRREPSNTIANIILGESYYKARDFDRSLPCLLQGIRGGESMRFILGRNRGLGSDEFGTLRLNATTITFFNQKVLFDREVTIDLGEMDFDVPYAKIRKAKVDFDKRWLSIEVDVPKSKGGKDEKKSFNFYLPASRSPAGYESVVCRNCTEELDFILKVIRAFSPNLK